MTGHRDLSSLEVEELQREGNNNSEEQTKAQRDEHTPAYVVVLKAQLCSDIVCNCDLAAIGQWDRALHITQLASHQTIRCPRHRVHIVGPYPPPPDGLHTTRQAPGV